MWLDSLMFILCVELICHQMWLQLPNDPWSKTLALGETCAYNIYVFFRCIIYVRLRCVHNIIYKNTAGTSIAESVERVLGIWKGCVIFDAFAKIILKDMIGFQWIHWGILLMETTSYFITLHRFTIDKDRFYNKHFNWTFVILIY